MSNRHNQTTRKASRTIRALARRHGLPELPAGAQVFTEYRGAPTILNRLGNARIAFIQIGVKGNWMCIAQADFVLDLLAIAASPRNHSARSDTGEQSRSV